MSLAPVRAMLPPRHHARASSNFPPVSAHLHIGATKYRGNRLEIRTAALARDVGAVGHHHVLERGGQSMSKEFKGTIKLDVRDSKQDWVPYEQPKAPAGAPNVLIVLYDDTGQAAWSPYGGKIKMPTLQKLADNGLRYSQWH